MNTNQYPISPSSGKPYWNPYIAGIVLGILLFLAFLITGNGLGASGGLNRFVVYVQDLFFSQHVDTTPFLLAMAGGDTNPLESWIVFMVLGALVGGFISGWLRGRVKLETNKGPQISTRTRWVLAFIGGALMGYGARLARGCTSGQALSGGATLSVGSWVFMLAVFAGAYVLAWTFRKTWN
ncbi:YeeE/YedE thiosulfate transporter family protein [Teredinibacter franksiae]|uniref:YeeE/YedE thiosulfate transporter family protein n=1 Tax=Teredinibacter franksiae TaxID=2761453 RepID=UPI0016250B6D|nr:YeeE/YedE thiosulfate transporter family protein [Teredinibacter franksiae]